MGSWVLLVFSFSWVRYLRFFSWRWVLCSFLSWRNIFWFWLILPSRLFRSLLLRWLRGSGSRFLTFFILFVCNLWWFLSWRCPDRTFFRGSTLWLRWLMTFWYLLCFFNRFLLSLLYVLWKVRFWSLLDWLWASFYSWGLRGRTFWRIGCLCWLRWWSWCFHWRSWVLSVDGCTFG